MTRTSALIAQLLQYTYFLKVQAGFGNSFINLKLLKKPPSEKDRLKSSLTVDFELKEAVVFAAYVAPRNVRSPSYFSHNKNLKTPAVGQARGVLTL